MATSEIDRTPHVSGDLLRAAKEAFPERYHEMLIEVRAGNLQEGELFFQSGVQTVIRLLEVWHNRGLENP